MVETAALRLMRLCDGLTDFQARDLVEPFLGTPIRVSGELVAATPNPAFGTAGVTIAFSSDDKRTREAFLWLTRDFDGLAGVGEGEVITAEGRIKSITSGTMVLEECGLVDPAAASIMKVVANPGPLHSAVDDQLASGALLDLKPITLPSLDSLAAIDKLPPLAAAEMERFIRLYLDIWGSSAVEGKALAAAKATYPDNSVGRDPFYKKLRAIRGPGKRGNPAFREK